MGKLALITGASSGIGKEMARYHASKKGDLIIVARSENKLNELKLELETNHGVKVIVIAKDLVAPNAARELYKEVTAQGLEIDYLINNAGFGGRGKFYERDWKQDNDMMQLNMRVLTELCRLFLPDFVNRNSGKILNVGSTAGLVPGPLQAVYYATKAYVNSFSYAIAEELHNTKVTVTALLPGATDTGFAETSDMEKTDLFKKPFPAHGVAKDGYDGMIKGELSVLSGLTFSQKIQMKVAPMVPTKIITKQIRKAQEV